MTAPLPPPSSLFTEEQRMCFTTMRVQNADALAHDYAAPSEDERSHSVDAYIVTHASNASTEVTQHV